MKHYLVILVLFSAFFFGCYASASEYAQNYPSSTKEEMRLADIELAEKIVSLRDSSSTMLLRLMSFMITIAVFVLAIGGLINTISMRGIMEDARKNAQEIKGHLQESENIRDQIKEIADRLRRDTESGREKGYIIESPD